MNVSRIFSHFRSAETKAQTLLHSFVEKIKIKFDITMK
ncbi:Uncharacterized protein dnm_027390 [Desulfonema magnum]|uniref:Uncharacterized protein n=1 Tax=Desulfonema magnum TaxID=45655 RepID=A0A975GMJ1_9BACT|nr:Uncharacterized protein dnm_027390 [Desulfonema magnum]